MDVEITCSKCKESLWLSPEKYENDGVDRWSVEPHICEAVEHSVQRTALQVRILNAICYGWVLGTMLWLLFGNR